MAAAAARGGAGGVRCFFEATRLLLPADAVPDESLGDATALLVVCRWTCEPGLGVCVQALLARRCRAFSEAASSRAASP